MREPLTWISMLEASNVAFNVGSTRTLCRCTTCRAAVSPSAKARTRNHLTETRNSKPPTRNLGFGVSVSGFGSTHRVDVSCRLRARGCSPNWGTSLVRSTCRRTSLVRNPCRRTSLVRNPYKRNSLVRNPYMRISLVRNCLLLGPCSRTIPRALWWSWGGGLFLMSDVPL